MTTGIIVDSSDGVVPVIEVRHDPITRTDEQAVSPDASGRRMPDESAVPGNRHIAVVHGSLIRHRIGHEERFNAWGN